MTGSHIPRADGSFRSSADRSLMMRCALAAAGIALSTLAACTTPPVRDIGETPASFHDTRLQYALVTDDRKTLLGEFAMQTTPTIPERVVAGLVLPITAAAETVFWPVSASFRAYHERY